MASDFTIGLYGVNKYEGGEYNILSSFTVGFHKALNRAGINNNFMLEFFKNNKPPSLTMSFNVTGIDMWHDTLKAGIPHIMWSVDSAFTHMHSILKFKDYKNFNFFGVTPIDKLPMKNFLPQINYFTLYHGVDPELWKPSETEKAFEIVFMGSIMDFDQEMINLKQKLNPNVYKMFEDMLMLTIRNPEMPFWQVYNLFSNIYSFELEDLDIYCYFFDLIPYLASSWRRIEMVRALENTNLKVWGNSVWNKYVSGSVQYMGKADLFDAVNIIGKSKIVLHTQPAHIILGLHERILNACASRAFVIGDYNMEVKLNYDENIGYFQINNPKNIVEQVNYYISNEKEAAEKAEAARHLTLKEHTWDCRVDSLLKILGVK